MLWLSYVFLFLCDAFLLKRVISSKTSNCYCTNPTKIRELKLKQCYKDELMRPSIGFGSIGIINLANPKVMII